MSPPGSTIHRSPVPRPTDSSFTVHCFLVNFLRSQDYELSEEDAQQKARRIKVDGKLLYTLPEQKWVDVFGSHEGYLIFFRIANQPVWLCEFFFFFESLSNFFLKQTKEGGPN